MLRRVFLTFALTLISVSVFAQLREIVPEMSKDSILIGDQISWKAKFNVAPEDNLIVKAPVSPIVEGVEIIDLFKIDTLKRRKKELILEANMILTSFDSGSYHIPPVEFLIKRSGGGEDTVIVAGRDLYVNTIQIDTATFVPFDIKGQFLYKRTFKELLPWITGGLILILGGILLTMYIVNKRRNRTLFGKPVVIDPPHIIALRELDKIRNKKLWQSGKEKEFYTEVTDALRGYIEKRFCVQAMEQTSNEILTSLKNKEISKEQMEELSELFSVADLVKFAKYVATIEENEKSIPIAVRFVNATYLDELNSEIK